MTREQIKTDYTDDEIKNLEQGKCFCGKPRSEFDKGMRVYCCKAHRSDWYTRTITWSTFKGEVLAKLGKKCAECGCTPESMKENGQTDYDDWIKEAKKNSDAMKVVELARIEKLNELEEKYQEIMNDDYMIHWELSYRHEVKGLRKAPEKDNFIDTRFEVDHIVAVSLGGEMWDTKNLQVLCYRDHKTKTAEDMKKLKAKRRGLKRFE